MQHQRVNAAELGERIGEGLTERRVIHTEHMAFHRRRIGQWTQNVEQGAHGELTTRADRILHRAVVHGRKHKPQPD